jgi:hypothetical protein
MAVCIDELTSCSELWQIVVLRLQIRFQKGSSAFFRKITRTLLTIFHQLSMIVAENTMVTIFTYGFLAGMQLDLSKKNISSYR